MPDSSPPRGPDETRDVIVYRAEQRLVPSGNHQEAWSVWIGIDKYRDVPEGRDEAIRIGIAVGNEHQLPVWLDEGPYPPKRLLSPA